MKFLLVLLMTNVMTFAQIKPEEKQLNLAIEELRAAMVDGNRTTLEKLAADELSYGHSNGHIEDKKEFVENIVSGKSDFVSIVLTNQTVSISGDVAVVRHNLDGETNNEGKAGTVSLHILSVWKYDNKSWKIIARQAVKQVH